LFASCKSLVGGGAALREDVASLKQGMTKAEVKERLGRPYDVNVTKTEYGRRTQWVYRQAYTQYDYLYVYFEDGALTGTQY
jgi:outer membrane protein assembly factor BamE (lipoprotein component of BamABCDE complex)